MQLIEIWHFKIILISFLKIKKKNDKILLNYGYKNFSQADEDGILEEIFKRIGTVNKTFIEIGVQDGYECNTLHLINQKWNGIWIEKEKNIVKKYIKF